MFTHVHTHVHTHSTRAPRPARYRLVEPEAGDILISGRSILNMGLHALRSKLAIIPQDPSLFAGTIRSNLDPTGAFTNDEIWSALNRAYLGDHVRTMDGGLEGEVSEGGSNLSAGEKQLLALARALLQRNKIIILDEVRAGRGGGLNMRGGGGGGGGGGGV